MNKISIMMTFHKLQRIILYLGIVNFLKRSEAEKLSPKIGNLFTESSYSDGYESQGNSAFLSSDLRTGKSFAFDLKRESFRCNFKRGYFADIDSGCQVFHICAPSSAHYKFKCPPGTLFNQRYLVCDWPYNVDCIGSESLFFDNAFQESPNIYDGFGPLGKELQEISKPASYLVPRSIFSNNPKRELLNESSNITATHSGNSKNQNRPQQQVILNTPPHLATITGQLQTSERSPKARNLPPKIIFAYTSNPNPDISIPQLLKDIQTQEKSLQTESSQGNGDSYFSSPLLSQSDSYLKNLPKRQIATILSTLKKLNENEQSDIHESISAEKVNKLKQQKNHFSHQSINFGKVTPSKSAVIINKSEDSVAKKHDHSRWNNQMEGFVPVTHNYLASSNISKPVSKLSSIQLQRINDFSTFRELNDPNSPKIFEISSIEALVNSSQKQSKSPLLQMDTTRNNETKLSSNKAPRQYFKIKKELRDDSLGRLSDKRTTLSTVDERNLESHRFQNLPNLRVNIVKTKSSIQSQDENKSTKTSNNNFRQPIKESKFLPSDNWSIKTSGIHGSRDDVIIPTPVTSFPDIPLKELRQNTYLSGQSHDNIALENVNTDQQVIGNEEFDILHSRKQSAERYPISNSATKSLKEPLESREIQPMNAIFRFPTLPPESLSKKVINRSRVVATPPLSESIFPAILSFKEENDMSNFAKSSANYHPLESGFSTTFSALKAPKDRRRNRLLSIANNNSSSINTLSRVEFAIDLQSQNGSKYLTEDVESFSLFPELKIVSTDPYYEKATTEKIVHSITNKTELKNERNTYYVANDTDKSQLNFSSMQISAIKSGLTTKDRQLLMKITTPGSTEDHLPNNRTTSSSLAFKRENLGSTGEGELTLNLAEKRRNNRRRLLKIFLNNRLKDFENVESEKRSKLMRKTPWSLNHVKKEKSTNAVKENTVLNTNPPTFEANNITDGNSISLNMDTITNRNLLSSRKAQLIGRLNSSVNNHSNDNLQFSSIPANELELQQQFLEFGQKLN